MNYKYKDHEKYLDTSKTNDTLARQERSLCYIRERVTKDMQD